MFHYLHSEWSSFWWLDWSAAVPTVTSLPLTLTPPPPPPGWGFLSSLCFFFNCLFNFYTLSLSKMFKMQMNQLDGNWLKTGESERHITALMMKHDALITRWSFHRLIASDLRKVRIIKKASCHFLKPDVTSSYTEVRFKHVTAVSSWFHHRKTKNRIRFKTECSFNSAMFRGNFLWWTWTFQMRIRQTAALCLCPHRTLWFN